MDTNSKTLNSKYIPERSVNSSLLLVQEVSLCHMSSEGCREPKAVGEKRNVVRK